MFSESDSLSESMSRIMRGGIGDGGNDYGVEQIVLLVAIHVKIVIVIVALLTEQGISVSRLHYMKSSKIQAI
jgi:hypothetical protein